MDIKFRRAFFGYRPEAVEARVNEIQTQQMNELEKLKEVLKTKGEETHALQLKLHAVRSQMEYLENMEADMGRALFKAHMEAVIDVSSASRTAEETKARMQQMSTNYESEYVRLKKTVKSLLGEIHVKVEEYKQKLGDSTNDKSAGENAG